MTVKTRTLKARIFRHVALLITIGLLALLAGRTPAAQAAHAHPAACDSGITFFSGFVFLSDDRGCELTDEHLRSVAHQAMFDAMESFGAANGHYRPQGSGFDDRGTGWGFYEGNRYPTSIASLLIAEGHLEADPWFDPDWAHTTALATTEGVVMVYQCEDRMAVFGEAGTGTTSINDAEWWAENDCNTYALDRWNYTYFKLSVPLD